MATVMERPVVIDADLARRARSKLRRNGWTYGDVLNRALSIIVAVRGKPDFMDTNEADETPMAKRDYSKYSPEWAEALRDLDEGNLSAPMTAEETTRELLALCS